MSALPTTHTHAHTHTHMRVRTHTCTHTHIHTHTQYHQAQLDVYIVFIMIPVTDLPIIGQLIAAVYGLMVAYVIISVHFQDVFLLFFQRVTLEDIE